jgi:sec-independent protein translocase protein TatB
MFGIGMPELVVILVVALLVLGPKELPNAIRTGASLLRAARKMAGEFRSGVDELVREAELDETRRSIQKAMSEGVENTIAKQVDPEGEIKAAITADPLAEAAAAERQQQLAKPEEQEERKAELIAYDPPPAPPHSLVPPGETAAEPAAPAEATATAEPAAPASEPVSADDENDLKRSA